MKNLLFIPLLFLCNILNGQVIIGKTTKIGYYTNIEVAQYDFQYAMTWDEAKEACKELGPRWRLPTINELGAIYLYAEGIMNAGRYWSSSEKSYLTAITRKFNSMGSGESVESKDQKFLVRAVRSY